MNNCVCGYEGKDVRDLVDHIMFMINTVGESFIDHHETHN